MEKSGKGGNRIKPRIARMGADQSKEIRGIRVIRGQKKCRDQRRQASGLEPRMTRMGRDMKKRNP